jgi:glycerophosphoryl diester phosphodiesterase
MAELSKRLAAWEWRQAWFANELTNGIRLRFITTHSKIDQSMWIYPKVLAHRGGGKLAPENTLAALRCGLQHGFRAVEFDVMLSSDSIPVLMHDPHFGRTVRGHGMVSEHTAEELRAMDAGAWFDKRFAAEPVPYYADAVNFCKANGIWMNVEIKPAPGFEIQTGRVTAELTQHLFATEIGASASARLPLFSSFSFEAVAAARDAAPAIPRAWLSDSIPADWLARLRALDALALHTNHKHLTPALARAVKDAGYGLFCYTINEPARAREIVAWGVDAFCTDRIDLIASDFLP